MIRHAPFPAPRSAACCGAAAGRLRRNRQAAARGRHRPDAAAAAPNKTPDSDGQHRARRGLDRHRRARRPPPASR